ncbi:flagellar export chaperone FliS [Jeotgalibacillus soli]|uniref:Flagellar secretion chaperone FliS n=1 Tax=Jeotgalibacillus soli TaxID=889306 RepID=A0A0C2VZZ9_9BACL|nr:flagellar export chaperone FliS [Jeotgalibacillus soli]KIL49946.1 flagellar biosynthesis protein FliS [Jeotgalibacillus soli]
MSVSNPYSKYQNNSVTTASPAELTLMLYNGSLKFMKQAKIEIEKKNFQEKNRLIGRTQDIVHELMVKLDMNVEISKNFLRIYDYINRRLIDANINNDMRALEEAEGLMTDIRDTWKEAIQLNRQKQFGQSGQA